jgi:osmotically inducible lipoprotein OsmB
VDADAQLHNCIRTQQASDELQHAPRKETIMKNFALRSMTMPALALAAVLGLAGCAGMTTQEKGTLTGAVVGGVVGNVLCGGVACTGAGAAVGGVIGHEVTKGKK